MNHGSEAIPHPEILPGDPELPGPLSEGLVHHQAKDLGEAERIYIEFLTNHPGHPQGLALLGCVMAQNKKYDEALWLLSRAIQGNPNLADPRYCTGNILCAQGRFSQAVTPYTNAAALGHQHARQRLDALLARLGTDDQAKSSRLLAAFYLSRNQPDAAIAQARRAIDLCPGDLSNWLSFSNSLSRVRFTTRVDEDLLSDIERAFDIENLDYRQIVRATISALAHDERMSALFSAGRQEEEVAAEYLLKALNKPEFESVRNHALLQKLLEVAVVTDIGLEKRLTELRNALLQGLPEDEPVAGNEPALLPLLSALARQCFLNEYAWAVSREETERLDRMETEVTRRLEAGDTVPASWVTILAAYRPLYKLACAGQIQVRKWPREIESVIRAQITEPLEENALKQDMPTLSPVSGRITELVRSQYEESPFPRWSTVPIQGEAITLSEHARLLFPYLEDEELAQPDRPQILVAGCGTGLIPNYLARRIKDSSITAIDLSLSSLAYARRKSRELNTENIEFLHGDILHLDRLGRQFDHINCYGVLHHMEDTERGWRALTDCLKPGGNMQIGLYSEIARRPVTHAREFIRERGYRPTPEDMRQCRQDMIGQRQDSLLQTITEAPDFFSMSEFRDLVFHYHEDLLTLPEIGEMIDRLGLEFLGFVFEDPTVIPRYRGLFPQDTDMRSLDRWDRFEAENPMTFASIYNFWVRKAD